MSQGQPIQVSEFRLMLYPKNFELMQQFYAKTLGFPILNQWNHGPNNRGVMFDLQASVIELLSFEGEHRPVQGAQLSLEVQNVIQLWEQLQKQVTIHFELRENDWGDISFAIEDPEGLIITFFTKI